MRTVRPAATIRCRTLTDNVSAIIAAGGRGLRFGSGRPKQLLTLAGRSILQRSVDAFVSCPAVGTVVVALPAEVIATAPDCVRGGAKPVVIVEGGERRRDSVWNAFTSLPRETDIVVVHDAARPLVTDAVIQRTIATARETGAAIAALRVTDTVKRGDDSGRIIATLPRDEIYLAQTPQAFRVDVLRDALSISGDATDEASLAEQAGHVVRLVEGDPRNVKITTAEDLTLAERLLGVAAPPALRVGTGYDLHRLVSGRPLILGGVTIPFEKGLLGHSDADVICHAVTDAILGAAGQGDIGRHFPDTEAAWKDANSIELLRRAIAIIANAGYTLVNVDVTVVAQRPKLAPHADVIRATLAAALGCEPSQVSVKGKTNEGVDSTGTGESIAAHAVALIVRFPAAASGDAPDLAQR